MVLRKAVGLDLHVIAMVSPHSHGTAKPPRLRRLENTRWHILVVCNVERCRQMSCLAI